MIVIRTLVNATTVPTENEELLLLGTPVELRVNVRADSIKNVSSKMIAAAILWLDPQYDAENKEYSVPEVVIDEIEALINIL